MVNQEVHYVLVVKLFEQLYDYDINTLVYNFNCLNDTIDKLPSLYSPFYSLFLLAILEMGIKSLHNNSMYLLEKLFKIFISN